MLYPTLRDGDRHFVVVVVVVVDDDDDAVAAVVVADGVGGSGECGVV